MIMVKTLPYPILKESQRKLLIAWKQRNKKKKRSAQSMIAPPAIQQPTTPETEDKIQNQTEKIFDPDTLTVQEKMQLLGLTRPEIMELQKNAYQTGPDNQPLLSPEDSKIVQWLMTIGPNEWRNSNTIERKEAETWFQNSKKVYGYMPNPAVARYLDFKLQDIMDEIDMTPLNPEDELFWEALKKAKLYEAKGEIMLRPRPWRQNIEEFYDVCIRQKKPFINKSKLPLYYEVVWNIMLLEERDRLNDEEREILIRLIHLPDAEIDEKAVAGFIDKYAEKLFRLMKEFGWEKFIIGDSM